MVMLLRMNER